MSVWRFHPWKDSCSSCIVICRIIESYFTTRFAWRVQIKCEVYHQFIFIFNKRWAYRGRRVKGFGGKQHCRKTAFDIHTSWVYMRFRQMRHQRPAGACARSHPMAAPHATSKPDVWWIAPHKRIPFLQWTMALPNRGETVTCAFPWLLKFLRIIRKGL